MSKQRRTIRVVGRVQGVGFRVAARAEALRLGLAGRAKNEADGSVTLDVEGEPTALAAFLDWCRVGPPAGRVERLEATDAQPVGMTGFSIGSPAAAPRG